MQRLGLSQSLQQKLSPQQIQFIKLLQVPTAELEARIEEELELNPVLEEGGDEEDSSVDNQQDDTNEDEAAQEEKNDELDIDDYLRDDDYASYKTSTDNGEDDDEREIPMANGTSLQETLLTQLGFLGLKDRQEAIGKQLIGSIEGDGYIRRELE
ncbi:MAG: RNA polymerase sigma-54 factor, partial [Cytophagales bacterium]